MASRKVAESIEISDWLRLYAGRRERCLALLEETGEHDEVLMVEVDLGFA